MIPNHFQDKRHSMWKPKEIFIHNEVKNDPVAQNILAQCTDAIVHFVSSGLVNDIKAASEVLKGKSSLLDQVIAGKDIVYVAPVGQGDVDYFHMPDERMNCPAFARLKHASNGCFYKCDWCYLKLTYRTSRPYITIKAEHEKLRHLTAKFIAKYNFPFMFNSGELADSLSLEHLSMFGQDFIPWFGRQERGYLFMLTKSDNVDHILNLDHNGHTVVAWSLNEPSVSRRFEIGAPPFERRLAAAQKVQQAGYPVRVRLDPIVPFEGWREAYAETIRRIYEVLDPQRITIGTLRFEEGFYRQRNTIFATGSDILQYVNRMCPMLPLMAIKDEKGKVKKSDGKYSFPEQERVDIFKFAVAEIRKYSQAPIALCKEATSVWHAVGLEAEKNQCVCQWN